MSINVYIINKLPKNTYSLQKEIPKYYIRCREEKRNNQNQNTWINIINTLNLQDFDKSKYLLEIVKEHKDIVIKIGEQEAIRKEYEYSKKIYNLKGFVKIIWYFEYKSGGSQMKIIIMPYFEMGSICEYTWTSENIKQLRSSIKQALLSNISAFTKGYLHGDFHPRNILLKNTQQNTIDYLLEGIGEVSKIETNGVITTIMDFDKMREVTKENKKDLIDFYFDIHKFFVLLQDYRFIKNIDKTTLISVL